MKSCELSAAACHLRSNVELLRRVAVEPLGEGELSRNALDDLKRQTARRAREVEAWGAQLKDPCALAAAHEAFQVLAKVSSSPPHDQHSYWLKEGAVVLVRVQHDCTIDSNRLVKRLIPVTLDMVLTDPPVSPMRAAVGLFSIDDQALLRWAEEDFSSGDTITTLAPLLVTFTYPRKARYGSEGLIKHLESATDEGYYCPYVPWPSLVTRAVVPLLACQIVPIERRCIGGFVCGRQSQQ